MQGCDVLALFGNHFADDFAQALDKMGWMIIRQPKTPGRPAVEHEPAERQLPSVGKQGLLFSEEPKSEIVQLPDSWFTLARRSGRSSAR